MENKHTNPDYFTNKPPSVKLDAYDRKILQVIYREYRIPVSKVAKLAKVSRTIAEYRLTQLRKKGIIRGFYY